jgi:NAD(P)-dependent dehydrogenase (short-subunit alcohol dehydrogenase family)
VLLHGRSRQRCTETKADILKHSPHADVRFYVADFTKLSDVLSLISDVRNSEPRLDVLISNAGVGVEEQRNVTEDGIEMVLQVNYLATYALCVALMPLLSKSRGRAICVTSSSQAAIDFDDPNYQKGWNGIEAYGRSKWAQAAFAIAFSKQYRNADSAIYALHPGSFMPTKLVRGKFPIADSLEKGVQAIWNLATCSPGMYESGMYLEGMQVARALQSAYDESFQNGLMRMSENMLESRENAASISWENLRNTY